MLTLYHDGLHRVLDDMSFADAVPMVKDKLAKEGFGVLTEIDVKATMKTKLDVDTRDYLILGACNPSLAHQALSAEPAVGHLLPCNVVVTVDDIGRTVVSAVDPLQLFSLVGRPEVEPIAMQVRERLSRALAAL